MGMLTRTRHSATRAVSIGADIILQQRVVQVSWRQQTFRSK